MKETIEFEIIDCNKKMIDCINRDELEQAKEYKRIMNELQELLWTIEG